MKSTSPGRIHRGITLDDSLEKLEIKEAIRIINAEPKFWQGICKKKNSMPGMYNPDDKL